MEKLKIVPQNDSLVMLRARFFALNNRWKIEQLPEGETQWTQFGETLYKTKASCDRMISAVVKKYPIYGFQGR